MKILVLRVINNSRHRKCKMLCTGLYSLVVCVKSPHPLGFSQKQLVDTTPYAELSMTRRPFFLRLYNNFKPIPSQPKTTQRLVGATKLAPSIYF